MKRKHYKKQKHYSGKELLERRKIEREEYVKQLSDQKPEDERFFYNNRDANNIWLYGDKAYIFCKETLVTVIQIPVGLMRDFKKMVKE